MVLVSVCLQDVAVGAEAVVKAPGGHNIQEYAEDYRMAAAGHVRLLHYHAFRTNNTACLRP